MIKWDEKYFKDSGLFVWVYDKGLLISSDEKHYRANLAKTYSSKKQQKIELKINNNTERDEK